MKVNVWPSHFKQYYFKDIHWKAQTMHAWLYMYIEHVEYTGNMVVNVLPLKINLLEIASATNHAWLVNLVFVFASLIYQFYISLPLKLN